MDIGYYFIRRNEYNDCSGTCHFFVPDGDNWTCVLGLDEYEVPTDKCPGEGRYKLILEKDGEM